MGFGGLTLQPENTNDRSRDNSGSKSNLNTAQSFGDFVYDAKAIEAQKKLAMEQSWNPMNGTFNVVEGSQL